MEQRFEHAALEQEIKQLAVEIKERGLAEKGKEGIRAVIQEKTGIPAAGSQSSQSASGSPNLPGYLAKEAPEVKLKVEKLLDMALHKGLKAAANEAKGTNPIVIDAFHDALADKLYAELKARGLIN